MRQFHTEKGAVIVLWSISALGGENPTREAQLAAGLHMVKTLLGAGVEMVRDRQGRPSLVGADGHLSVSHAGDSIAIIYNSEYEVAIDIEPLHRDAQHIAQKFTTSEELETVGTAFTENPAMFIWTCKECLFKWLHTEGVLFREHLSLVRVEPTSRRTEALWRVSHPSFSGHVSTKSIIFESLIITYIDQPATP